LPRIAALRKKKISRAKAFLSRKSITAGGGSRLSPTIRKPQRPLFENASAASDGGSYGEMMLIQAARQSVARPKTIERSKSVGRDSVEPQVVDRSQLPRDAASARPPIFHRQHADATLT